MGAPSSNIGVNDLVVLRRAGLLHASQFRHALNAIRDEGYWSAWGRRALLALGVGQFLAGVVFFFAYNWNDLSDFAKFGVVEGALALAALGALVAGLERAIGRSLLIAASVLTGVLLAVIGQVYQTGADAFELFAAWAALILPWTIISRSAVQWLLWLVVTEVAIALYGEQVLWIDLADGQIWVLVGATIALALVAREAAVERRMDWLAGHWTRLVLLVAALFVLFWPAAVSVVDTNEFGAPGLCIGAFVALAAIAGFSYWRVWPDFAASVIVIGFLDMFFIAIGFRLIDESIGFDFNDAGPALTGFGAMIAWAVAGTGSAAFAMRQLRTQLSPVPA